MANLTLTRATAQAAADGLTRVVERLEPVLDLSALKLNMTPEGVLGAAVAGAAPSKCFPRVRAMLGGGFAGLRAFVHLGTEAAAIKTAGFDPFADNAELDKPFNFTGVSEEERALTRHEALFVRPEARGVWAAAHLEAVAAELKLVELLVTLKLEKPPEMGMLFWFDPGASDEQINLNADVAQKMGVVLAPRSVSPRAAFQKAYDEIVALANG